MRKHWFTVLTLVLLMGAASSCSDNTDPAVGAIEFTVATSSGSPDAPPTYTIKIDDAAAVAVPTTGTLIQTGLAVGEHSILLAGLASNCTVIGENPRTMIVANGATTDVDISIDCTSPCPPGRVGAIGFHWRASSTVTASTPAFGCRRAPVAPIS